MAGIPISKYIDITTHIQTDVVGNRNFTGLVICDCELKDGAVSDDYDDGYAIQVDLNSIGEYFDTDSEIYKFASKVLGYSGNPGRLYVAKVLEDDSNLLASYNRIQDRLTDFGVFTYLLSGATGTLLTNQNIVAVARENDGKGYQMLVAIAPSVIGQSGSTNDLPYLLKDIGGTHLIASTPIDNYNYGAWTTFAWYSSVNYSLPNASMTIDYRAFDTEEAVVDSGSTKDLYDEKRVNYIGKVQVYGSNIKFYQAGVNTDGTDIGVFRDSVWIKSRIEQEWFNLVTNNKVPASMAGAAAIHSMITSIAEEGCNNGVILLNKPLTNTDIIHIRQWANDSGADVQVATNGYYVSARLMRNDEANKWTIQYVLIYAKGDHISKVEGGHYLV